VIKIEVSSGAVDEKRGTGRASGRAYVIREQSAYAFVVGEDGKPAKYPVACKLPLEDDQPAYAPGMYTFDARAVIVGDFGRLALGRVKLVPVIAAGAARAV
jgi:hypothetical protein